MAGVDASEKVALISKPATTRRLCQTEAQRQAGATNSMPVSFSRNGALMYYRTRDTSLATAEAQRSCMES
jgi:hypothetical protein